MEYQSRPLLQRAVEPRQTDARPWHRTLWFALCRAALVLIALVVVIFQLLVPLYSIFSRWHDWDRLIPPWSYQWLQWSPATAWGEMKTVLGPIISIAFAFVVYYIFAHWRIIRFYRKKAHDSPTELVETATKIIDDVPGRRELCEVLIERIRDPATRSPMVLIGGVGAGKTATLVELTRKLAAQDIVPIPIRLRDTAGKEELNFKELAREKFKKEVDSKLFSDGHMERLWRELFRSNEVAILADGLDEAIQGAPARDSAIREAIQQAVHDGLPLVIASRPYDPLRGMKSTVIALEPLGEGAAIEYVSNGGGSLANRSIAEIATVVHTADVAQSPMFLRVIRDLEGADQLPRELFGGTKVDIRGDWQSRDRATVRLALLRKWCEALCEGGFRIDYAHTKDERRMTEEILQAFACLSLGLNQQSPQFVHFDRLYIDRGKDRGFAELIRDDLQVRLRDHIPSGRVEIEDRDSVVIAIQRGEALGFVDEARDGVRFQYGDLQAYLAAEFMSRLSMKDFRRVAKQFGLGRGGKGFSGNRQPSRELLDSLIMMSRMPSEEGWKREFLCGIVEDLLDGARTSEGKDWIIPCWRLEMYAAALEIDAMREEPEQYSIIDQLLGCWDDFCEDETAPDRPLDEAKLHLVRRAGDAVRILHDRSHVGDVSGVALSYERLFRIALKENSYRVRLAAAREVGLGGIDAVEQLCVGDLLAPPPPLLDHSRRSEVIYAAEAAASHSSSYRWLSLRRSGLPIAGKRASYSAAQAVVSTEKVQLGTGDGQTGLPDRNMGVSQDHKNDDHYQIVGWVLPLLYLSTSLEDQDFQGTAGRSRLASSSCGNDMLTEKLDQWLFALPKRDPAQPHARFSIRAELALAQGFRLAANLRRLPRGARVRDRSFMVERAELALRNSGFWYSQIALIQALTLLSLPDDPNASAPPGGHVADPWAQVQYWIGLAGSAVPGGERGKAHPFVTEVGRFCLSALLTLRPERYIWIDESETASRVGACSPSEDVRWHQTSWIPDSMGWSLLVPRAQRLLADVMLLYNLADRGDSPDRREVRLARSDRSDLPPCMTSDREALQVKRNLDLKERGEPGKTCLHGCPFRLCPLPARGERLTYQMDQSFCARQADLASTMRVDFWHRDFWKSGYWRYGPWRPELWRAWFVNRATWQAVPRSALSRFWRQMSERDLPDDRW
ncbi:hypothetical protein ACN27J_25415 [Solwaraspora sp. WMMB762]|uniref:hypothetical protein n=1 Tax=Solwaraspora sp. WMMB762 TaxID=3404120 RepID=UPI003B93925A